MANNKNKKSSMAAEKEKIVMSNLEELIKLLGVSRTFRKLEEILDDEFRFNSTNLKKRGEYEAYASCYKLAYGNSDSRDESNRLERLARVMIAHNIGYVITDMLRSYTQTQEYITCGHYDAGVAFRASGTIPLHGLRDRLRLFYRIADSVVLYAITSGKGGEANCLS